MLSLAKLALLASEEDEVASEEKLMEFDSELELVSHQEDLPTSVLNTYGYDITKLGVLTPAELIKVNSITFLRVSIDTMESLFKLFISISVVHLRGK